MEHRAGTPYGTYEGVQDSRGQEVDSNSHTTTWRPSSCSTHGEPRDHHQWEPRTERCPRTKETQDLERTHTPPWEQDELQERRQARNQLGWTGSDRQSHTNTQEHQEYQEYREYQECQEC